MGVVGGGGGVERGGIGVREEYRIMYLLRQVDCRQSPPLQTARLTSWLRCLLLSLPPSRSRRANCPPPKWRLSCRQARETTLSEAPDWTGSDTGSGPLWRPPGHSTSLPGPLCRTGPRPRAGSRKVKRGRSWGETEEPPAEPE